MGTLSTPTPTDTLLIESTLIMNRIFTAAFQADAWKAAVKIQFIIINVDSISVSAGVGVESVPRTSLH